MFSKTQGPRSESFLEAFVQKLCFHLDYETKNLGFQVESMEIREVPGEKAFEVVYGVRHRIGGE